MVGVARLGRSLWAFAPQMRVRATHQGHQEVSSERGSLSACQAWAFCLQNAVGAPSQELSVWGGGGKVAPLVDQRRRL